MLLKKDLINDLGVEYKPMIDQISIADFTKCIAQFSGLGMNEVADSAIKEYLTLWAKHKYRFFELMGNKVRKDFEIKYEEENKDISAEFTELGKSFPAYALWLELLNGAKANKIEYSNLSYYNKSTIERYLPGRSLDGCSLTHFFKTYLKADDSLVTKIGRLFENTEISANYTISIDPVDMMLASENPYNWTSCYRLENMEDSHADGCLAAIIDSTSLITYVWNNEGKFVLEDMYDFKNVRYKRMRKWIAVSEDNDVIHFNETYPGRHYSDKFEKILRQICEDLINPNQVWSKEKADNFKVNWTREYYYGYGEFSRTRIYTTKDFDENICQKTFYSYDEEIICPCGCGTYLAGSDENGDEVYNGDGFTAENCYFRHYCNYCDDYCECENCEDCEIYNRANAVCELDESEYCENSYEAEEQGDFKPWIDRIVRCSPELCENCPLYELHHKDGNVDDQVDEQILEEIERGER